MPCTQSEACEYLVFKLHVGLPVSSHTLFPSVLSVQLLPKLESSSLMPPKKSQSPSVRASSLQPKAAPKRSKTSAASVNAASINVAAGSYGDSPKLAEEAFLGYGRLNLLEDEELNPDAQWMTSKFAWATHNNRPAEDGAVKDIGAAIINKPAFDSPGCAMNFAVETVWLSADDLASIRNCLDVKWSNAALKSIPAVRLRYSHIVDHGIKPLGGNVCALRFGDISYLTPIIAPPKRHPTGGKHSG